MFSEDVCIEVVLTTRLLSESLIRTRTKKTNPYLCWPGGLQGCGVGNTGLLHCRNGCSYWSASQTAVKGFWACLFSTKCINSPWRYCAFDSKVLIRVTVTRSERCPEIRSFTFRLPEALWRGSPSFRSQLADRRALLHQEKKKPFMLCRICFPFRHRLPSGTSSDIVQTLTSYPDRLSPVLRFQTSRSERLRPGHDQAKTLTLRKYSH